MAAKWEKLNKVLFGEGYSLVVGSHKDVVYIHITVKQSRYSGRDSGCWSATAKCQHSNTLLFEAKFNSKSDAVNYACGRVDNLLSKHFIGARNG